MGPEARGGGTLGGYTGVSDSVDDGEVEAWWIATPNASEEGRHENLGRKHLEELSESTSSTIGGGGRGCNIFVPVLEGNGTKLAPTGDRFDQPSGQRR